MIIQVDKEGKTAVSQLCEIAVRYAGVQLAQGWTKAMQANAQSLHGISVIMGSVKLLPEKAVKPLKEPKKT